MRVPRTIANVGLTLAITTSLLLSGGAVASAGTPGEAVLYIVHGVPGIKVDVCIGGMGEVESGMKYATRLRQEFDPGTRRVRIRRASKGMCKGKLIARAPIALPDGANVTAVLRLDAGEPTLDRFDNDVAPTDGGEIRVAAAHMMKGGPVDLWIDSAVAIAGIARGEDADVDHPAAVFSIWGTRAGKDVPIVGPRVVPSGAEGSAYTFVMVGTTTANNVFVAFKQNVGVAP